MEPESKNDDHDSAITNKAGFIQISPTREGPWTIMRLNYAAPAACWSSPANGYADHPLPNSTAYWGCFRPVIT
ncbi:hypothetical protein B296_00017585 [Ensete ventricosum]|uniref:Uncharacterized protein n=1 Tax=Ensete ventricosum TaxID=4639 RepID=A0A427AR28_ENSVE|nr:hypothetical protein B296_00017585 [Ensete ventricosum]